MALLCVCGVTEEESDHVAQAGPGTTLHDDPPKQGVHQPLPDPDVEGALRARPWRETNPRFRA